MDIVLRPWSLNDLDDLVKHANNFNIAKYMGNIFPHPYTVEDAKAFIEMAATSFPIHIFAITLNGKAIGGIGVHPKNDIMQKNAELGYWLAEPYWGKGIATKAITQIVPFAFSILDITRIYAIAFGNNLASQRVLEKCGFQLEAHFHKTIFKNGEFLDELFYAFRKQNS
jgi:Acetyltransferases, including N-acetylases of ribosomal proteins